MPHPYHCPLHHNVTLRPSTLPHRPSLRAAITCLFILLLAGCSAPRSSTAVAPTPIPELILYDWNNDLPSAVLEQFEKETGVHVVYLTYESQGEAIQNMRTGHAYDVVVMESRYIPMLVREGRLAALRHQNLPNFRNISPNFRDLDYDSDNQYSIPYSYGTTGLLVRSDLTSAPVTSWKALWDERYLGRVAVWRGEPQEVIGLTLRMLGYPANTSDPAQLEQARTQLLKLAPHVLFVEDYNEETAAEVIIQGAATVAMGYSFDYFSAAEKLGERVSYVLPDEGALLWGDTFVIPANSEIQDTAEQFINFLLRAEVNAQVVNYNRYATANEAALALIDPEIRSDPVIFPLDRFLREAEIIFPASEAVQQIQDQIWKDFLAAAGK